MVLYGYWDLALSLYVVYDSVHVECRVGHWGIRNCFRSLDVVWGLVHVEAYLHFYMHFLPVFHNYIFCLHFTPALTIYVSYLYCLERE